MFKASIRGLFAWPQKIQESPPLPANPVKSSPPVRILLVDDEETNRKFLHLTLERYGYKCAEVENSSAAIQWLKENEADLMITDIFQGWFRWENGWRIPIPTGLEYLEKLAASPLILPPTIILSGALHSHPAYGARALKAGAVAILDKPCSLSHLLATVARGTQCNTDFPHRIRQDQTLL